MTTMVAPPEKEQEEPAEPEPAPEEEEEEEEEEEAEPKSSRHPGEPGRAAAGMPAPVTVVPPVGRSRRSSRARGR